MKNANKKESDGISFLRFLLSYIKLCRWFFIGSLLSLIVSSVLTLRLPVMVAYFLKNLQIDSYFFTIVFMVFLLACVSSSRYCFAAMLGENMAAYMRRDAFSKLLRLPSSFFDSKNHGEVFAVLVRDTESIKTTIGLGLSIVLRNVMVFIGAIFMMIWISPNLAMIILGILSLTIVLILVFLKVIRNKKKIVQVQEGRLLNFISDRIGSMFMLQAFNAENDTIRRYEQQAGNLHEFVRRAILIRTRLTFVSILSVSCGILLVLWLGIRHVTSQNMSGDILTQFMIYTFMALGSIRSFVLFLEGISQAINAVDRLQNFIKLEIEITSPAVPIALPLPSRGQIAFRDVSFCYPGTPEKSILKNIRFTVRPGETVAIVGLSGVGKTTIFSLALRFYDPNSGCIELDGVDLRHISLEEIRRHISWVPQDPILLNESLHDNIAIGFPGSKREDVQRAAMAAQAHEFIMNLERGYDTIIGENSLVLSTGQCQRIAIARAILKDSPILLLDEITSALDAENEVKIWKSLRKFRKGRTTILIAHRFSVVQETDTILLLDNGRLLEQGIHKELISRSGPYAHLVELQSSRKSILGACFEKDEM
ncbi:ATP-binding cassette domain-containing protein [Liberibacter sp. Z1]|nr:ATP-binding cassette domain-containing protein [Candidatus Liberibacter sp.]